VSVVGAAIGAFLLLLVVAYLIARPLFAPEAPAEETEESKLVEEKERLLTDIRELDMDFATGKLTEEDYQRLRARSMAEAAVALQAIAESADAEQAASCAQAAEVHKLPDRVEDTADAEDVESGPDAGPDDEIEREIAERKRAMQEHGCPGCGAVIETDDRFCRKCGTPLASVEAEGVS